MLQKLCNQVLVILNFLFVLDLFSFKFFSELIYFFFLLIKNFVFLLFTWLMSILFIKIWINFSNILLVSIDHFSHFDYFFINSFNFSIVLFDPILQSFSCFSDRQIEFIGLQFKIFFLFQQRSLFFFQMLGSLFQRVWSKSTFSLCQPHIYFFKLISRRIYFLG